MTTQPPGRPVVQALPVFPSAPELPPVPFPERRTNVGGLVIRPLAGPSIAIPANEDEDFIARFQAAHAARNFSLPEYITYEFLVYKKKQIEPIDFQYQNNVLGGRTELGGFVLDFFFPLRQMAWNVQGLRYHLLNVNDRGRDRIVAALMESRGIQFILLWEDDLLTRADYVLELAWEGRQVQERRPESY